MAGKLHYSTPTTMTFILASFFDDDYSLTHMGLRNNNNNYYYYHHTSTTTTTEPSDIRRIVAKPLEHHGSPTIFKDCETRRRQRLLMLS